MAVKGAVKTLEAALATFLLLSFVILAFKIPGQEFSSAKKEFVENLLEMALASGYLKEELAEGNLTKIKGALQKIMPFDFELGMEQIDTAVFYCENESCTFYFGANKSLLSTCFLSFFSNESGKVNITLNSKTVFSGRGKKHLHIYISSYLQNSNELRIEKSPGSGLFVVLHFVRESVPERRGGEVVAYPCYAGGVKKLYVFL